METNAPVVEVHAIETFADLLFAVDTDGDSSVFYNRLCEATCQLANMSRAVVFVYDEAQRRVRVVGSHGISIDAFRDYHVDVDSAPMALRALAEDRVIEAVEGLPDLLPPEYEQFLTEKRLVCTPVSAAGRWPGVIFSERPADRPLNERERHLLWSFGKIAALADSARTATRGHEHAKQLQERIDLAREIHDGVLQRLFGVSLALSGDTLSEEQRRRCATEVQESLAALRSALQRPLGRPPRDTPTTLVNEVRRLSARFSSPEVGFAEGSDTEVPGHLEPLAQSVLIEALRNALKHADPTWVRVRIDSSDGAFVLEIVNDGVPDTARHRSGLGLRLAAVEALQHGGVVEFGRSATPSAPAEDAAGGEWRVRLLVPIDGDEHSRTESGEGRA